MFIIREKQAGFKRKESRIDAQTANLLFAVGVLYYRLVSSVKNAERPETSIQAQAPRNPEIKGDHNTMKLGIVGLPNVGKSTLFNSLTKAGAESANYPFCTIDPNIGIVAVPDERLKLLGDMYHSRKVTPATIEFVDIA